MHCIGIDRGWPQAAVPLWSSIRSVGSAAAFPLKLFFRFFGAFLSAGELRADRPSELGKCATAGIRAAGFPSGFDLLVRSHVGLRCLRVQLGSGNLPLVPLGESLVHRPTVQHLRARLWRSQRVLRPSGVLIDVDGDGEFTFDRVGRGTVHASHLCLSVFGMQQRGFSIKPPLKPAGPSNWNPLPASTTPISRMCSFGWGSQRKRNQKYAPPSL